MTAGRAPGAAWRLALAALAASALSACASESVTTSAVDTETPGGDAAVDVGASIDAGGACTAGTLGCACTAAGECGVSPGGEALACNAGTCGLPSCPSGGAGCACRGGSVCDEGLDCAAGVCVPAGCAPGTLGCSCVSGTCGAGLFCQGDQLCVDGAGHEGNACLPGNRCLPGARCEAAQGVCVHCDLGSQGCACQPGDVCAGGLACSSGTCVDATTLPPKSPLCWTPCNADLVEGATTRRCGSDGLLAGCLTGRQCVGGSCLAPGEAAPTCSDDLACPFFQKCLSGGCYSNCQIDADCSPGLGCWNKVCRAPCQDGSDCPSGTHCDSPDGQSGFCVAVAAPPATTSPTPTTGFSLGTTSVALSNRATTGTIELGNTGIGPQKYTVRKLSHTVYAADGTAQRVDAPRDPNTGAYQPCDPGNGECPLYWLSLSDGKTATQGTSLDVTALAGCAPSCSVVTIAGAADGPGVRYDGELEVTSASGRGVVHVSYVQSVAGRWTGNMVYLGTFASGGVDAWRTRADKTDASGVDNALVQRWAAFRSGALDGWSEFEAVLASTRTETWKNPNVAAKCSGVTGGSTKAACYPYTNTQGVRVFVQDTGAVPIPSGATELPFAIDVRPSPSDPTKLVGRIESSYAMHEPANPSVVLDFAKDPAGATACDPRVGSDCVVPVDAFQADLQIGGRYLTTGTSCAPGFAYFAVPWLLPGFSGGTQIDAATATRVRGECRDVGVPYDPRTDPLQAGANADLSLANPVPDGRPRARRIQLLDGALVDQTHLFLLFQETFDGFVPGQQPISAYGYIVLQRGAAELDDADFEGSASLPAVRNPPALGARCDASLLASVPNATDRNQLVDAILGGGGAMGGAFTTIANPLSNVHYYCEDTGLFDAGDDANRIVQCPVGSAVTYFEITSNLSSDAVIHADCQKTATCANRLAQWIAGGSAIAQVNPVWSCSDPAAASCDANRADLRAGKTFWRRVGAGAAPTWVPMNGAIDAAFRYKVRFQSDLTGTNVSFAPRVCATGSDAFPYCYDPPAIEDLRSRADCLLSIYTSEIAKLDAAHQAKLQAFLRESFAGTGARQGFERLYAELLVMLGDDALTAAYASRFDLAGLGTGTFLGSRFEPGGMDLTGVPGNEMSRFYQAIQYYQLALDRLYALGPDFAAALSRGTTTSSAVFVSPETATTYVERLTRAASQKARAWSEVAKRYQGFNRPDLAKTVAARSYAQTYLESVLLQRLLLSIADSSGASWQDSIRRVIEDAQTRYTVALGEMRTTYEAIDDDTSYFGYPRDYVPFPVLDPNVATASGYDVLSQVARAKVQLAKEREQLALQSSQSAKLDAANFQSELVQVRLNYENQLAELCGTFVGTDGKVYPAIRQYAYLSANLQGLGDPCGLAGNGAISDALAAVKDQTLVLESVLVRKDNVLKSVDIEKERVAKQCNLIQQVADYQYGAAGQIKSLNAELAKAQIEAAKWQHGVDLAQQTVTGIASCAEAAAQNPVAGGVCGIAVAAGAITSIVGMAKQADTQADIASKQQEIAEIDRSTARWVTAKQCDAVLIDSNAKTADMLLDLKQVELDGLRAQNALQLALASLQRPAQNAQRLQAQQQEAQQQLLNVEAARNDPNVRIYRNDAVINADLAFDDAIAAVYKATRVYEYYTSQSYAGLGKLFLVRMVTAGQPNLENYLNELDDAYAAFQDSYGLPDLRVAVLSLRDDILKIPTLDGSKRAYTQGERIDMMRARLADPALLDQRGYLTIPFGTSLGLVSPLTRNHKIAYIETDLVGSNVGDTVGRLYVRQAGTGVTHQVGDGTAYYAFPPRTSVVNTFFNGNRIYAPDVYRNVHLRDRPFVNTLWQLVINQRDESVNQDIDLQSLSDIRVLVYYTDFTVL